MSPIHQLESDSDLDLPDTNKRHHSTNSSIPIYIIQSKLDPHEIDELYSLVESSEHSTSPLRVSASVHDAEVIVTSLHMRRRLERHISWDLAASRAIVTPDWVRTSVKNRELAPCADFAAIQELHDETAENCPCRDCDAKDFISCKTAFLDYLAAELPQLAQAPPYDLGKDYDYRASFSCERASPLKCINQELVQQLAILSHSRELEGNEVSALSYARAVSVMKAYPQKVDETNLRDVCRLPSVGQKISSKITEFVEEGSISESLTISSSDRYMTLLAFTKVHGIGPARARDLYDEGYRTIDQLRKLYSSTSSSLPLASSLSIPPIPNLTTSTALELFDDIQQPLPRSEVEEIHQLIKKELRQLMDGWLTEVCGGYRRGRPYSNDVDIVIGHEGMGDGVDGVRDLSGVVLRHLHENGLVTHVIRQAQFKSKGSNGTLYHPKNTLSTILTLFKSPTTGVHHQVDFIFARPEAYWTAVVGWTGSKMFERDIRRWAKERKALKFDSSALIRRYDSHMYFPKSEQDVFDLLGLKWIHPTLRNADA